jgi:hypothetical protein
LVIVEKCQGFLSLTLRKHNNLPSLKNTLRDDDDESPIFLFSKDDGLAILIAFGANFMGVTSFIMTNTDPQYFRSLKVDELYSIGGYNRCFDAEDQYQFIYPGSWVKDRYILLADARDREMPVQLRNKRTQKLRPDTAYGPPQGNGKENLSVVKNSVMPGFSLKGTLGAPREAAQKLLDEAIAPPGSEKIATLIDAYEVDKNGTPVYIFEFTVKKGEGLNQHSVTAIASRGTELYTLTFVSPQDRWELNENIAKTVAASFEFTGSNAAPAGFY